MSSTDISNGALSWDARITTGNLAKDAKTVAELLASIGNVQIDTSVIEKSLKEQADREIELQKQVTKTVQDLNQQSVTDFAKSVQQQSALAKISIDDLRKYIDSVPFTVNTNNETELSQEQINAINANNKGVPITNTSSATNTNAKSQQELNQVLTIAKQTYDEADASTKKYLDDLASLEVQLLQVNAQQKQATAQFNAGTISEDAYIQTTAELKASQESINTAISETKDSYKQYQASLDNTVPSAQRLMTQLRQMKNQIAENSLNGIVDQDLIDRAANLERTLANTNSQLKLASSNTAFIDAFSEGVRGLVGGFAALSGVVGLFTDDQDKANKIMQDTINFMGVINGVEQISQALATNGKLNSYIKTLLQRNTAQQAGVVTATESAEAEVANAAASEADAAAKEEEAVATEGATAAQWSLNAAMDANPAGVVLLAITALVAAIELMSSSNSQATEDQKLLNEQLERAYTLYNDLADIQKIGDESSLSIANQKLDLLKAQGAATDKIIAQQKVVNDLSQTAAKNNLLTLLGIDKNSNVDDNVLKDKVDDLVNKARDAAENAAKVPVKDNVLLDIAGAATGNPFLGIGTDKDSDDANKQTRQISKERATSIAQAYQSYIDAQAKGQRDLSENAKEAYEKSLESDTAYWQSRVTIAQEGSKAWLSAQLGLNKANYNKSVSNPNATSGDLALAQAELIKANKDANDKFNLQQISDNEDVIQAQLDQVKQGSQQELALKLELLNQQTQAQIINAKDNAAQIEKINADSLKKQDDLKAQYEQKDVDRVLQFQQDFAKQQLAETSTDSDTYLNYTKGLNINAAQQQTESILKQLQENNPTLNPDIVKDALTLNISNYEAYANSIESIDYELAQKLRTTWAETIAKNQQADNAAMQTRIDNAAKIIDIQTEIANTQYDATLNNQNSSDLQKANAELGKNRNYINAAQSKLTSIAYELQKDYGTAGVAVQEYINQVEQNYSKIKDLSKPDSDISHVFDGIKDPKVKQLLTEYLTQFEGLTKETKKLGNQKVAAVFDGIDQVGSDIATLGNSISSVNEGLGDTITIAGQLVSSFSKLGAGIASGNPLAIISGVVNVATSVIGLFSAAKKSAEEAKAKIATYNEQLVIGQIQYNEELIKAKNIQAGLTQGTLDQLTAQIKLNDEKKKGYQTDLDSLTAQLQASGQYVASETKKKTGFIIKKTKVVQNLASLGITDDMTDDQIANILKLKESQGTLTDSTKKLADEWLAVYENIGDAKQQAADLKEQLTESFAGTTADDIAQSIIDGLKQGKTAVAQFGDDINSIISNALLSSIKNTLLSNTVSKIWEQFEDDIAANTGSDGSTGSLTAAQIAQLQAQSQAAVQQGIDLYTAMESVFPELAESLSQANGLTGAIQQQLTEETGDELAGLWRGQYDITKQTLQVATQSLNAHLQIQQNTYDSLQLFIQYLPYLKSINTNTTPVNSTRNLGV